MKSICLDYMGTKVLLDELDKEEEEEVEEETTEEREERHQKLMYAKDYRNPLLSLILLHARLNAKVLVLLKEFSYAASLLYDPLRKMVYNMSLADQRDQRLVFFQRARLYEAMTSALDKIADTLWTDGDALEQILPGGRLLNYLESDILEEDLFDLDLQDVYERRDLIREQHGDEFVRIEPLRQAREELQVEVLEESIKRFQRNVQSKVEYDV